VNTEVLEKQLSAFKRLLATQTDPCVANSSVANALRELYATKSASVIVTLVGALHPAEVAAARASGRAEDEPQSSPRLPNPETVENIAPRLLQALALGDGQAAVSWLVKMGIFALCAPVEQQFKRLEFCVGCVVGRPRLIPLVELAIVAAELGVIDRARTYLAEAHILAPEPTELHDLYTVAGHIALSTGEVAEAKRCLAESARICRQDDFACLTSSIRPFNLTLAERLLTYDEGSAVIEYLSQCRAIWTYDAGPIAAWIEAIQNGQKPNFLVPSVRNALDEPAAKILSLAIRSSFLAESPYLSAGRLDESPPVGVDRLLEEYKEWIAAALRGKLDVEKN
jgi:hypothetical protein